MSAATTTQRSPSVIGLIVIGTALAVLATALATGQPAALVARLPSLPEPTPDPGIAALAETKSQGFEAAIRRWSNDATLLAADPRWASVQAASSPADALLDAFANDAVAPRYANVLLIDRNGRVQASLYPSRRVGQRVIGNADPLARAVATSRATGAVGASTLAVEDGRAAVFLAAPAAGGASVVLAAGAQQLAPLLDPSVDGPTATVELMVSIDGHWHRLSGDARGGFRLLRAAADADRDVLLGQTATGTSGVRMMASSDGSEREAVTRTVPALGAVMLLTRPPPVRGIAADLARGINRWGIPAGLALLAVAAFASAARLRRRTPAPPASLVASARHEPKISSFGAAPANSTESAGTGGSGPVAAPFPPPAGVQPRAASNSVNERGTIPATPGPRSGQERVRERAPEAEPDTLAMAAGPAPARMMRLADVFAAVSNARTGAGGELLIRRGQGIADERLGDAVNVGALLGQMVDLVGAGRPGMPIVLAVERDGSQDALLFTVGASIDGSLPTADAARVDVTHDAPAGWDAATTVAIDAAGRCALALGGSLASSADGRVLALRASLPARLSTRPAKLPYRGRRAILVADDELTAGVLAEQLVRLGFDVHELEDLRSALDEARRSRRTGARPCDLIVLDDRVADARDLEQAPAEKANAKLPPIVLLQGRHASPAPASVTLCLNRPLDEPALAAALATLPDLLTPSARAPEASTSAARQPMLPAASPRVLDSQAGRARAGGDVARYRSLLAAFVRDHRGEARQFAALLAGGRPSEARERLRALADASAMLGLPALARITASIEEALRNGRPVPPSRLHELGATLTETLAAAEAASTEPAPTPIPLARIADSVDRTQLWQHFDDALARGDIIALDLFERLAHGHDGAAWQALRDALLVLDYARAAEIRPRVR